MTPGGMLSGAVMRARTRAANFEADAVEEKGSFENLPPRERTLRVKGKQLVDAGFVNCVDTLGRACVGAGKFTHPPGVGSLMLVCGRRGAATEEVSAADAKGCTRCYVPKK